MKRVVAVVVLVSLIINCTYRLTNYTDYKKVRPISISVRTGEVIDAEERKQFGLFPGVTD